MAGRRRNGATHRDLDRRFPYQVRFAVPRGGLGRRLSELYAAARVFGRYGTKGALEAASDAVLFCFAEQAAAIGFQAERGGELVTPLEGDGF